MLAATQHQQYVNTETLMRGTIDEARGSTDLPVVLTGPAMRADDSGWQHLLQHLLIGVALTVLGNYHEQVFGRALLGPDAQFTDSQVHADRNAETKRTEEAHVAKAEEEASVVKTTAEETRVKAAVAEEARVKEAENRWRSEQTHCIKSCYFCGAKLKLGQAWFMGADQTFCSERCRVDFSQQPKEEMERRVQSAWRVRKESEASKEAQLKAAHDKMRAEKEARVRTAEKKLQLRAEGEARLKWGHVSLSLSLRAAEEARVKAAAAEEARSKNHNDTTQGATSQCRGSETRGPTPIAGPSAAPSTLYEALGIDRNASIAEIRQAYRRLAVQWHPDKNASSTSCRERAERMFKVVATAYQVLSDVEKRSQYDRGLRRAEAEERREAKRRQRKVDYQRRLREWQEEQERRVAEEDVVRQQWE